MSRLIIPDLEQRVAETFTATVGARTDERLRIERLWDDHIATLADSSVTRKACVIGCGPQPMMMKVIAERGIEVAGVDPNRQFVESANGFLSGSALAVVGTAETIPFDTESQDVVICDAVLEHVDSMEIALAEMYRVLRPGGVLYVSTTNRRRFDLLGRDQEFRVRFYNWLPRTVQESYVHAHLHFDPTLANYASRPAVHWLTFADLCALGRRAGFAWFYAVIDLIHDGDARLKRTALRRLLLRPALIRAVKR
ncbi:MAG: class I SAM-dependent methyltransferase, partial [Thermoanaerobaculia bacterium]